MKKDKQAGNYTGDSKVQMAAPRLPPLPDPPQIALMLSIGFTAATLGLLIYVAANSYHSLKLKTDQVPLQPMEGPIK